MNKKKIKIDQIYYIDRLAAISWLFYILPYLVFKRENKNLGKKVVYVDATKLGILSAKLTSWLIGAEPSLLNLRCIDVRDESGTLIQERISNFELSEIQNVIVSNPIFQGIFNMDVERKRLPTYLKKQITSSNLFSDSKIERIIFLIRMIAWMKAIDGNNQLESTLFINRRIWSSEISFYANKYNTKIKQVNKGRFDLKELLQLLLGCKIWILKNLYFYLGSNRIINPFKRLIPVDKETSQPCNFDRRLESNQFKNLSPLLAIMYTGHLNLNSPEMHSDLFFLQQSKINTEDILITFQTPLDPIDEKKLLEIRNHKMNVVVTDPRATKVKSVPVFYHWPHKSTIGFALKKSLSEYGFLNKQTNVQSYALEQKWLKQQIANYYIEFNYWTDLFKRYGVMAYVSWNKYGPFHCVIADALESLGGVTAIYQRAFEEFPSPSTTVATDIVFAFSQKSLDKERDLKSIIPYHVTIGYIGDHRFPLLKKYAQQVRDKLRKRGATKILAFFDENSGGDPRLAIGHELTRINYAFLLEKVLSEPWLGLVLKPKTHLSLRERLGVRIADLLRRAEETGRCFILERGALVNCYPPALAALASDIAIHGHLCAATAGVESALAGVPTLFMDYEKWHMSSLYKLGKGQVVFTDWQDLWNVCQEHWNSPSGIPGFGDWSSMLDELDPFRDGRAAERMGTYLNWILDGFKAGLPRKTVLADAAERYCKIWGKDKISSVNV